MLTALVLQLIQCVVYLPERLHQAADPTSNSNTTEDKDKKGMNVSYDFPC